MNNVSCTEEKSLDLQHLHQQKKPQYVLTIFDVCVEYYFTMFFVKPV